MGTGSLAGGVTPKRTPRCDLGHTPAQSMEDGDCLSATSVLAPQFWLNLQTASKLALSGVSATLSRTRKSYQAERASTAINCRKSENGLTSTMNNPALTHAENARAHPADAAVVGKRAREISFSEKSA
jgi:hypothetical protein